MKKSILVVDDEPRMRRFVRMNLDLEGYEVLEADNGLMALQKVRDDMPDLVLLDVAMPEMDGFETLERIREVSAVPVIMLTVKNDEADRIRGLDLGADDYVTKPFAMEELLARARATLRRATPEEPRLPVLRYGGLEIDLVRRLVVLDDEPVHLTPTEYSLLEALVSNPGKLLTHQWLLRRVWGQGYGTETTYLRTYVRALRKKLGDDAAAPDLIVTEPGVGYRWVGEPTA